VTMIPVPVCPWRGWKLKGESLCPLKNTNEACRDLSASARSMAPHGEDEAATLQSLNAHRQTMCSTIERHKGRVVGSEGDRLLAVFDSAAEAVQCAIDIQEQCACGTKRFRQEAESGPNRGASREVTEEEGNFLAMASRSLPCWKGWRCGGSAFPGAPTAR